jgi:hypothetical protein
MKRTDYITWDEYFMGIALLSPSGQGPEHPGRRMHRKSREEDRRSRIQRISVGTR